MSDRAFFDTNVLIYAVAEDGPRAAVAGMLLAEGGVISVQVMNEFVAIARRKLRLTWDDIATWTATIRVLCPDPVPITLETHDAAIAIAARYGFGWYDSLIAAAAQLAGCARLYSEDFQDGQVIDGGLTIRNPFRA